jgi:hypothetical protein
VQIKRCIITEEYKLLDVTLCRLNGALSQNIIFWNDAVYIKRCIITEEYNILNVTLCRLNGALSQKNIIFWT